MTDERDVIVTLEPVGRRVTVAQGSTLLEAAQAAGVALVAVCGGVGACSGCRVRLVSGSLTPVTLEEEAEIRADLLVAGWRMACQAEPRTDVVVDVPPESLTAPQRLLIEGETARIALDPVVMASDVVLEPADLTDLRADVRRLLAVLPDTASVGLAAMRDLPNVLRAHGWRARVALRGGAVVAVLPPAARLLGLAADVGTTSLAAYLVDLETGETA
ncbi:MAG TPA: 2Fe-2S iron-sulfur cluster-binding protein, partial [Candidatus Limnocylindrales bacterium]|nr:2Fe-2S iron-sulfur cluster-binding protein [Candidatus Limnocylindrales bacterium]